MQFVLHVPVHHHAKELNSKNDDEENHEYKVGYVLLKNKHVSDELQAANNMK